MYRKKDSATFLFYFIAILVTLIQTMVLSGKGAKYTFIALLLLAMLIICLLYNHVRYNSSFICLALFIIGVELITIVFVKPQSIIKFIYYGIIKYTGFLLIVGLKRKKIWKEVVLSLITFLITINIYVIVHIFIYGYNRVESGLGCSLNTIAAINLLVMPFVSLKSEEHEKIFIFLKIMIFGMVIVSGSKIACVLLLIVVVWNINAFLKQKNTVNKLLFAIFNVAFTIPSCVYIIYKLSIESGVFNYIYERINNYFLTGGGIDFVRKEMWSKAINEWIQGNILFGIGKAEVIVFENETYPHNFILENLLLTGGVGTFFFVISHICLIYFSLKKVNEKRYKTAVYITAAMYFGMGFFHPVVTAGITYNLIYFMSIYIITEYTNGEL